MDNFFTAVKVIAFIILKINSFFLGCIIAFAVGGVTGIESDIFGIIFAIIFSCIPSLIIVKIKEYSFWWAAADIAVTFLIMLSPNFIK